MMRVRVCADKCQGHNRCRALAPELFDVDDYGQSIVIGDGTVPIHLEDKARLAVANCPESAISLDDTDRSGSIYGAVTDWATDFDHADPAYNRDVHAIWTDLRARCPVAHTDRYDGAWLALAHELVREIAYDTEHFSNNGVLVSTKRPEVPAPIGAAPPITSDPPFHRHARRLLLPPFAPKQIEPWQDHVRTLCRQRLDAMGPITPGRTIIDAARQYAQHIPVTVIARMLGFPLQDDDVFRGFVADLLEEINRRPDEQKAKGDRFDAYIDAQIEDHRAHPRDDLTSYLMNATLFDQPLSHEHVRGSITVLLVGGIDTTWSAIGASIWHLAAHPDDLRRLVAEPAIMSTAIEEFLRAYAPVTMARLVTEDRDFHGCSFKSGDWVLLPFPAANRDPEAFEQADRVVLDRQVNPHVAFGLGIHRCLGSNLARVVLRVAVEEFIARFPVFDLADPDAVVWSVGQIRGPRQLPIRILATT